ncbi:DNA-binding response regulator [Cytobacillus praedii]|uniref:DNA-binding response regulator n=1 Tax=Cytobacillus praedii TaxID=1742358 RepID=UPI002E1FA15A|nr:DNA-binding response regulator [Cytobacillus praedii]
MKTFHDIENALRDYHWMVKEIARLKDELNNTNSSVTAKYGIEATLPKGNGTSDSTPREVIQRDRRHKTLRKFESKVVFIDDYSTYVEDDREIAVLNCLLDGMSIVSISQHLGFSERKVYSIKDDIVRSMKENAENAGNATIAG